MHQTIQNLHSADLETRIEAVGELMVGGPDYRGVAHEALFALADEDEEVREQIVGFLEELGPPVPSALALLIENCTANDDLVAYWSLTLIGRLGPDAASARDICQQVANDASRGPEVRRRANWASEQM